MSHYFIGLVTVDTQEKAVEIANMVVRARLAACVNLVPQIRSIYTWKDEVCDETETLMIIKTKAELFGELQDAVKAAHPYEVPEIIGFPIEKGLPDYFAWIDANTKAPE